MDVRKDKEYFYPLGCHGRLLKYQKLPTKPLKLHLKIVYGLLILLDADVHNLSVE